MKGGEVEAYLRENGYPEHLAREGKAGLIRRWREFVGQVERGYKLGLEDYRNDLDIRGILKQAGAEDEEVLALDERLKKVLEAAKKRVWESAPGEPFWDHGVPIQMGEALREGLREEDLIQDNPLEH